jgi:hypothetical protein
MSDPTEPRLVAADGARLADVPPAFLDLVKDDLGIPLADTTNDAWLQRRIDGVWARFEKYCCRALPVPPAQFVDDWGEISETASNHVQPPAIDFAPLGSPFLRYCPVVSIDAVKSAGQTLDASLVRFEPASGKLFTLDGSQVAHDLSRALRAGQVQITYTAGWDEMPGDLYEALIGALTVLWGGRQAQQAGAGGGGTLSSISVVDLGQVDFDTANPFITAAMRSASGPGAGDPLLGPWTALLDNYMDVRVQIGSPLIPTTRPVPTP